MISGTGCGVRIQADQVPLIGEALEFAAMGLVPAGAHANRAFRREMIRFADAVQRPLRDLLFDPQTSGGLLIGVETGNCRALIHALHDRGVTDAAEIGEVVADGEEMIRVEAG